MLLLLGIAAVVLGGGQASECARILALLLGVACSFVVDWRAGARTYTAAMLTSRGNAAVLEYAAPVVAAGREVAVEIGNVAPWLARTGWGMWLVFLLGTWQWCCVDGSPATAGGGRCGLALIGAAFLSIRGGAALFFGVVALVAVVWWLPRIWQAICELRAPKVAEAGRGDRSSHGFCYSDARAAKSPMKPAESMIHDWQIRDGRLRGTIDVTLRGEAGDRFLLLRAPAVLSGFEGAGLRVVKALRMEARRLFHDRRKGGSNDR